MSATVTGMWKYALQEETQVKKLWVVAIVVTTMFAIGAVGQTSIISATEDMPASSIATKPFPGCNGDEITLGGDFTQTTSTWVDGNGDTHVRTQVTSSNLTASSSVSSYTYTLVFSQKTLEAVSPGVIDEGTLDESTTTFRLKLLGEGPLNSQIIIMEVHWTTLLKVDTGTNNNHVLSKCTG